MSIIETDSSASAEVRRRVVDQFAEGWREPGPHAWDGLLAEDVRLRQPLMPDGVGRDHWQREFARLQAFLPDLVGEVTGWAGSDNTGNTIYIEVSARASAGGRPLRFDVVDRLTISDDGLVTARTSFLDPLPLIATLVTRPRVWPRWWRSGVGPLVRRRLLTDPRLPGPSTTRARAVLGLGVIRTGVGVTSLISPRTAYRALDPRSGPAPVGGFLARGFGIREIAVGALTLSGNPATARIGLRAGVLVDSIDTAAVLLGRRRIPLVGRLLIGLPAAAFAIIGAAVLAGAGAAQDR